MNLCNYLYNLTNIQMFDFVGINIEHDTYPSNRGDVHQIRINGIASELSIKENLFILQKVGEDYFKYEYFGANLKMMGSDWPICLVLDTSHFSRKGNYIYQRKISIYWNPLNRGRPLIP